MANESFPMTKLFRYELMDRKSRINNQTRITAMNLIPFNFETNPRVVEAVKVAIDLILELGVPVVVTVGNRRAEPDEVTRTPAVLYTADLPIIVVSATNINGSRYTSSQSGAKLAVHASGVNVKVSNKDGRETTDTGTSFGKFPTPRCDLTVSLLYIH